MVASEFIGNKATRAGAIYATNHELEIRNCNFSSNRATQTNGGALDLSCPLEVRCVYEIIGNNFTNNSALVAGGAIKWDDVMPSNLTTNTYEQNTALYGPDRASYPTKIIRNKRLSQDLTHDDEPIENVASGQPANYTIRTELLDHYEQRVTSDSQSEIVL